MTGTIYPSVFLNFYFSQLQFFYMYFQSFVYYFCIFSIQIVLSRLFLTIAKISGLLSVYIYVSIYLLRILLSLSCILPFKRFLTNTMGFSGGSDNKETACSVGDLGLIPGQGGSSGEVNSNPLHHVCLENPMDRGAWWAAVHRSQRVGQD